MKYKNYQSLKSLKELYISGQLNDIENINSKNGIFVRLTEYKGGEILYSNNILNFDKETNHFYEDCNGDEFYNTIRMNLDIIGFVPIQEYNQYLNNIIEKLKNQGFEEKEEHLVKKVSNKLYIHYRKSDEKFDFLNSKLSRKNNKIFFEDFEITNDSIIAKNVYTLERHYLGKNRTAWQFREEIVFDINSLTIISETPLRWEK